jgi:hypothetical protein
MTRRALHNSGRTPGVAVAQHVAAPVNEVHACASLAGDPLAIVLGRIVIVVQPVLDPRPSDRIDLDYFSPTMGGFVGRAPFMCVGLR